MGPLGIVKMWLGKRRKDPKEEHWKTMEALGTETGSMNSKEKLSLGIETAVSCEQLT